METIHALDKPGALLTRRFVDEFKVTHEKWLVRINGVLAGVVLRVGSSGSRSIFTIMTPAQLCGSESVRHSKEMGKLRRHGSRKIR